MPLPLPLLVVPARTAIAPSSSRRITMRSVPRCLPVRDALGLDRVPQFTNSAAAQSAVRESPMSVYLCPNCLRKSSTHRPPPTWTVQCSTSNVPEQVSSAPTARRLSNTSTRTLQLEKFASLTARSTQEVRAGLRSETRTQPEWRPRSHWSAQFAKRRPTIRRDRRVRFWQ